MGLVLEAGSVDDVLLVLAGDVVVGTTDGVIEDTVEIGIVVESSADLELE